MVSYVDLYPLRCVICIPCVAIHALTPPCLCSAGALATAIHLVTPSSRHLYQQAIVQSAPLGTPLQTEQQASDAGGKLLVQGAGCDLSNSDLTVQCLVSKSWQQIIAAQKKAQNNLLTDLTDIAKVFMPWAPTVGNSSSSVLNAQVLTLWQQQPVPLKCPLMMGNVDTEGVLFMFGLPTTLSKLYYPLLVRKFYGKQLGDAVVAQYPIWPNETIGLPALARALTDGFFKCALRNATISVQNPSFLYNFKVKSAQCLNLTCHGDELFFLFNQPGRGPNSADLSDTVYKEEIELSARMQERWGSFVKTGDPNTAHIAQKWPRFSAAEQRLLEFDVPSTTIAQHPAPFDGQCALWDTHTYF